MSVTASSSSDLVVLTYEERGSDGRVAWVTFNNPERRNALGTEGKQRFVEVMDSLRHDQTLRAVVITGAGDKSFVGGTDLSQMANYDVAAAEKSGLQVHRMCDAVRTCPVPVIARINGYCFGSGFELAACADMRVGADHAKFGMPETRHGIPSAMEASVLARLIGWGKATELVLTGDWIDSAEAYRIGYLEKRVPYADLDQAVNGWLDSLFKCGPRALRLQKRIILDWDRMSPTEAARSGIQIYAEAYTTDEPHRMMTAFLDRKQKK